MSSAKWRPFCLGLNVFKITDSRTMRYRPMIGNIRHERGDWKAPLVYVKVQFDAHMIWYRNENNFLWNQIYTSQIIWKHIWRN